MTDVHADVSTYQVPVDSSYTRKFLAFRICSEYGTIDKNCAINLQRATSLRSQASHPLLNFAGYIIPGFISTAQVMNAINSVGFPKDAVLMIDAESWGGQVSGNHSNAWNDMANQMRSRQGGRADLVWGYGNQGDLDSLWPSRNSWLKFVIAKYSSNEPDWNKYNGIAWQYTDGTNNPSGQPASSSPFGNCDHNALRAGASYPLPTSTTPPPSGDWFDMATLDDLKTAVRAVLNEATPMGQQNWADSYKNYAYPAAHDLRSAIPQGQTQWPASYIAMYNRTGDMINRLAAIQQDLDQLLSAGGLSAASVADVVEVPPDSLT